MSDPFVGVLAGATVDHLLTDVPLHITLCDKNPKGKVVFETTGERGSLKYVLKVWDQSTRQCKLCAKKYEKWLKGESDGLAKG